MRRWSPGDQNPTPNETSSGRKRKAHGVEEKATHPLAAHPPTLERGVAVRPVIGGGEPGRRAGHLGLLDGLHRRGARRRLPPPLPRAAAAPAPLPPPDRPAASPDRGVWGFPTHALGRDTHAPIPPPPRRAGHEIGAPGGVGWAVAVCPRGGGRLLHERRISPRGEGEGHGGAAPSHCV